MLSLDVPTAVMRGDSIWLNCTLDLESDDLYSVKWYKNDVEFYRYLPRDNPAGQKYDLPGVYLDVTVTERTLPIMARGAFKWRIMQKERDLFLALYVLFPFFPVTSAHRTGETHNQLLRRVKKNRLFEEGVELSGGRGRGKLYS
ncbi:hypothetical protein AVEN_10666-1 [Araneus ventricosus]|uniref:Ig-like domain-containing protein n=1 Tax=Araneus ventricosus TaxID=182803 RepID=A0A4Y2ESU9_ARAVE|nr:hypothetical protein AVEN_10666-1 [Araneus ventricosus]